MSNLSTLPKGDSAWLLRKAIERIIQQVSVLETNIGASTSGNSANTQIIFNDNGTLRGDAGLVYNKTTDALTVAGLVTAGSATITGDLTVDTSTLKVDSTNDRVGFGTASPAQGVHLSKSSTSTALTYPPVGGASFRIQNTSSTNNNFGSVEFYNAAGLFGASVNCQYTNQATPTSDLVFVTRGTLGGLEHYRIAADGVATWSEVGGVAGTALTLNSTGLGIGVSPGSAIGNLQVGGSTNANLYTQQGTDTIRIGVRASGRTGIILDSSNATYTNRAWYLDNVGSSGSLTIGRQGLDVITFDNVGNVGIGVTPSAWGGSYKALQLQSVARSIASTGAGVGDLTVAFNAIYDSTDSRWEYAGTGDKAGRYSQTGSGNHRWFVSNTAGTAGNEITDFASAAMTLDASGYLLLGTTDTTFTSGAGYKFGPGATPSNGQVGASSSNGDLTLRVYSTGAAAYRFYVGFGGTVFATSATISAISDARLKENVQNLDVGLNEILALKPRKFDWKAGKGKDIKGDRGFIAQEFETVFPNLIDEWADPAPEGEAPYKSVRQDLIPVLVKAIQELTARVQTLETR